jgi:alpha-L-fucosidase
MARKAQPGILVVDRTVHGKYENYQTPEQRIPEKQLDYPWESCMTLGNAWGYVPNDQLKSSTKVIHSLIEIVAKGGSLLLGVGPKPDGTLSPEVIQRLGEIGEWMKKNGEAIYKTNTVNVYQDRNTFFTQSKQYQRIYALVCLKENEAFPDFVEWNHFPPIKKGVVRLLETGESVKWTREGELTKVFLPSSLKKSKPSYPALVFGFSVEPR